MIDFVQVQLGSGEIDGCALCGSAGKTHYDTRDQIIERYRAVASDERSMLLPGVLLVGPEPFGHPELPAVIAGLIDLGATRLGLHTLAAPLAAGQNAAGSIDAGVRHLHIRLHGSDPESSDAMVGRPGTFDGARNGVRSFREAARRSGQHVALSGRVRVCRHNLEELPAMVGLVAADGGDSLVLESAPELESGEAIPWFRAAMETGLLNGVWVSAPRFSTGDASVFGLHSRAPFRTVANV